MNEYARAVAALEERKCKKCNGTGELDDSDLGDISYNRWQCDGCKGRGMSELTAISLQRSNGSTMLQVHTAGWNQQRFAVFSVDRVRCGDIHDGIAMDLKVCEDPNKSQWTPGGVISFEDFEAVYLAAKKFRENSNVKG